MAKKTSTPKVQKIGNKYYQEVAKPEVVLSAKQKAAVEKLKKISAKAKKMFDSRTGNEANKPYTYFVKKASKTNVY